MDVLKRIWGDHWGLRRWAVLWLGLFVGFVIYAKLGGLDGYRADTRPPFSRKACLNREENKFRERNPDVESLPDEVISRIAATCAREESDYYYPQS